MTTLDMLKKAILLDPADDLARLAYADALEENGQDERAELIRTEGDCTMGMPDRASIWWPIAGNLMPVSWVIHASAACDATGLQPALDWELRWRRGFISLVRCSLQAWLGHGKAICAAHPVERVEITDKKPASNLNPAGGHAGRFGWWRESDPNNEPYDPESIPPAIWDQLPWEGDDDGWASFATDALAIDALSEACLIHAESPSALARMESKAAS